MTLPFAITTFTPPRPFSQMPRLPRLLFAPFPACLLAPSPVALSVLLLLCCCWQVGQQAVLQVLPGEEVRGEAHQEQACREAGGSTPGGVCECWASLIGCGAVPPKSTFHPQKDGMGVVLAAKNTFCLQQDGWAW